MPTSESRRIAARRRRQERAAAVWDPTKQVDTSWMRNVRCKLCGTRICVNNYPDRQVRLDLARHLGVVACWRCRPFVPVYIYARNQAAKGDKKAQKLIKKLPWGKPLGEIN